MRIEKGKDGAFSLMDQDKAYQGVVRNADKFFYGP